jgi:acetyl-CoA acetyltransferase
VLVWARNEVFHPLDQGDYPWPAKPAPQLSDGAFAMLPMSAERAKKLGVEPLGIYRRWSGLRDSFRGRLIPAPGKVPHR